MSIPIAVFAGLVIFGASVAFLVFCLGTRRASRVPDAEWLRNFNVGRYRPMLRMLSEEDPGFLAAQGLDAAAIRRIRQERREVFRVYLDNLVRDFNLLHSAARAVLLASPVDRPEFAERLIRLRIDFQRAVLVVRFRLLLHSVGLSHVDVRELVHAIEAVYAEFQSLAPAPGKTAAS